MSASRGESGLRTSRREDWGSRGARKSRRGEDADAAADVATNVPAVIDSGLSRKHTVNSLVNEEGKPESEDTNAGDLESGEGRIETRAAKLFRLVRVRQTPSSTRRPNRRERRPVPGVVHRHGHVVPIKPSVHCFLLTTMGARCGMCGVSKAKHTAPKV